MSAPRKYTCEIEWCINLGYAKGLCKSHYYHLKKTGKIAPKPDIDGRQAHPLYGSWAGMISRCHNQNHSSFARYGGKGIYVCDRWRADFRNFLADMGERPEGKTLDRYPDPAGPYAPDNCRWATAEEQRANITADGDRRVREALSVGSKRRWETWRADGAPPLPPRSSKLSYEAVDEIRSLISDGVRQKDIAAKFAVSASTISDIASGRTRRFSPNYLRKAASALE